MDSCLTPYELHQRDMTSLTTQGVIVECMRRTPQEDCTGYKAAKLEAEKETAHKEREYQASLSPAPKKLGVLPPNFKQLIYEWANMNLKDPYSAKYTFGEWYSGYIPQVAPKPSIPIAVVFLFINSKNSYGAYGGQQIYRCAVSGTPRAVACFDHTPSHWKFDERTYQKL